MGFNFEENQELNDYTGTFIHETFNDENEGALFFLPDGWDEGDEIWLPKSQIIINLEDENDRPLKGSEITIQVPLWLAGQEGLD